MAKFSNTPRRATRSRKTAKRRAIKNARLAAKKAKKGGKR